MTYCPPKPVRCICGTHRTPRQWRRGPKTLLVQMRCPACGHRSPLARPEHMIESWNADIERIRNRTLGAPLRAPP